MRSSHFLFSLEYTCQVLLESLSNIDRESGRILMSSSSLHSIDTSYSSPSIYSSINAGDLSFSNTNVICLYRSFALVTIDLFVMPSEPYVLPDFTTRGNVKLSSRSSSREY